MPIIAAQVNQGSSPWLILLFALMGTIGTVVGLGLWYHTRRFLGTARETTGEVVDAQWKKTVSGGSTSYPVIHFQTLEGQDITYQAMAGTLWAAHSRGQKVPILYNPQNPEEARIKSFTELWLPGLIFFATGAGMLLCLPLAILLQG